MRWIARILVLLAGFTLTAGPLLAAPVSLRPAAVVTASPQSTSSSGAALLALLGGSVVFGAIRIKDAGSLAKKFVARAGAAAKDYTDGVAQSGADWEAGARAGADNYKLAVVQAANEGRFEKGIAAAGQQKFVTRAQTLGAQRYPSGVQAAEGSWSAATQPYLQTIAGLNLPPRRPKGDPGNAARSQAVAVALRQQKLGK